MAKAVVKSRPAEKEAVMAMSKKSKSLEKKSKKKLAIHSPEAKKVSLALKKEKKTKKTKKTTSEVSEESPEKEIELKPEANGKTTGEKTSRFAEMKKIHKVIKEKKNKKEAESEQEEDDKDSDASEDEEDVAACKSYAQDFGLEEMEAANDSEAEADSDEAMDENEGETKKDAKPAKESRSQRKKRKSKKPENFVDQDDPEEQARTVLMTNVNIKSSRKQITKQMRQYGRIVSVRFRNLPVLAKQKSRAFIGLQAKLKQFKKEASSCSVYVKFQNSEQAEAALAANGLLLDRHHVFVKRVEPKSGEQKRRELSAGNQIMIGNLPYSTEAEPLYRHFISCGKITSIAIPRNKLGNCTGIAFIEFEDKSSVPDAVSKNGEQVLGREMRVVKVVRKVKKSASAGAKKGNTKNTSSVKKSKTINGKQDDVAPSNKKTTPTPKKQAAKKHGNKEELKKRTIARKLAAKQ